MACGQAGLPALARDAGPICRARRCRPLCGAKRPWNLWPPVYDRSKTRGGDRRRRTSRCRKQPEKGPGRPGFL